MKKKGLLDESFGVWCDRIIPGLVLTPNYTLQLTLQDKRCRSLTYTPFSELLDQLHCKMGFNFVLKCNYSQSGPLSALSPETVSIDKLPHD